MSTIDWNMILSRTIQEPRPPRPWREWPWKRATKDQRDAFYWSRGVEFADAMQRADARLCERFRNHRRIETPDTLLVSPEMGQMLHTVQISPTRPYTVMEALRQHLPPIRIGVDGLDDAQIETEENFPPWSAFTVIGVRNGRAVAKYVIP